MPPISFSTFLSFVLGCRAFSRLMICPPASNSSLGRHSSGITRRNRSNPRSVLSASVHSASVKPDGFFGF